MRNTRVLEITSATPIRSWQPKWPTTLFPRTLRTNIALRWHAQKPFYELRLSILEPQQFKDREIASRLYCTPKAMWKLGWFLRDFTYDPELLSQSEVDERALRGLVGVVKISHAVINGIRLVNLDDLWRCSRELSWD